MSIVSFAFFVFVAVSLLIYYVCPIKVRWIVPLLASATFFVWGCGPFLFALMCAMAIWTWFCVTAVGIRSDRKNLITAAAIIVLAIILLAFKENVFFTTNANILGHLFGWNIHLASPGWLAPIGMSYFTLMLIGYILDVSWGRTRAERNPLKVLLFTCYFPQMTLGPFTRFGEMRDELFTGHHFDYENFCFGLQRMVWGLFKKLVLAERLAIIVQTVYSGVPDGSVAGGTFVFIGAIAYVFQLYMDFSGAIDIIIGVSQMFGIKLPENFRQPFFSRSLSEIWRRWHMTLGLWLRDYVMYPVQKSLSAKYGKAVREIFGKKRGKDIILYASMLITWFCVGFWHGGSWKYICSSGLFFFVMITGGLILEPVFDALKKLLRVNTEAWSWHLFQSLRSFSLFALSVSFGRSASLTYGFRFWETAFNFNPWVLFDGSLYTLGLDTKDFWVLAYGMLILLIVSILQQNGSLRKRIAEQNLVYRWALYMGLFFAVIVFGQYGSGYNPSEFIYGGF